MLGVFYVIACIIALVSIVICFPKSSAAILFEYMYEKVFGFYESVLGTESNLKTKTFIVALFFIIFITNIAWVILDFIAPIFGTNASGAFILSEYIRIPSSDIQFNLALAIVSMLLLLYLQFGSLGVKNFFLTYFPLTGKWYLEIEKWSVNPTLYMILFPIIKFFDIVISLFLAFLDLIGLLAKIVSLSFRLFWNIISGGVLIAMLIVAMSGFTENLTGFLWGISFPIIAPIFLYLQSLLVACIQAMVFPLLVAIFIRVSQLEVS